MRIGMLSKVFEVFDWPAPDPIGAQLPLMGSAWPVTILMLIYLLIVLKYGKKFMENRNPYEITKIIIGYNIFQVIYNSVLFCFCFYNYFIDPTYDLSCMIVLPLDHPSKNIERTITYAFIFNKIIDLLDTIFFVLRKSYKQITVLHVYHHALLVYYTWWVHRIYGVGGQFITTAMLNTLIHTIMYFYYMTSAIYPGMKDRLWWKKGITIFQIIQFIIIISHSLYILIFNPECKYPLVLHFMIVGIAFTFLVMFTKFYIKTYVKPRKQKKH
ncbi:elongation of very long chain fatty acids protein F-like [Drosophila sulfurigaster albostrigata]|uniref:elongation of very long chain fatty acids protein F-like n=1 Tax=Drosophila sulfurigaster albostrigata TaxID=89887 RepID=UPI002D21A544|nr:elongation of very long chain fatty acids protein F-like [Drosophila sulfurigaster albostrigata]